VAKGKSRVRAASGRSTPESAEQEQTSLLGRGIFKVAPAGTPIPPTSRLIRAVLYGATVFLSFFLMLVFMTYNAYLILSVVVGAAIGHYILGSTMNADAVLLDSGGKTMACH